MLLPWVLSPSIIVLCFCLFCGVVSSSLAGSGSSIVYSFLLFTIVLSLREMYMTKLASSEFFTILGAFTRSILFLVLLMSIWAGIVVVVSKSLICIDQMLFMQFIGNFQESCGMRTGWGAVILAEAVALIAASTVRRVCSTTCFIFSAGLLYEVNKISGSMLSKSESKTKRHRIINSTI